MALRRLPARACIRHRARPAAGRIRAHRGGRATSSAGVGGRADVPGGGACRGRPYGLDIPSDLPHPARPAQDARAEHILMALGLLNRLPAGMLARCNLLPQSGQVSDFFEREHLSVLLPALMQSTAVHPRVHAVWGVIIALLQACAAESSGAVSTFWETAEQTLFTSSHERKCAHPVRRSLPCPTCALTPFGPQVPGLPAVHPAAPSAPRGPGPGTVLRKLHALHGQQPGQGADSAAPHCFQLPDQRECPPPSRLSPVLCSDSVSHSRSFWTTSRQMTAPA